MQKRSKILIILIVLILCFIWGNSLMLASTSGTISEMVKDVINAILGRTNSSASLSDDGVLRKVTHATEFAVLGALLMLLMTGKVRARFRSLILCGFVTAFFDETIQLFVMGRSGQIMDVWIDFLGFSVGVLISALFLHLSRRRINAV